MNELDTLGITTDDRGMILPDKLSFDDYEKVGKSLAGLAGFTHLRLPWLVGDWMNYGEAKFGEKCAQAVEFTGMSWGTLSNWSYTARNVPRPVRNPNLGISHHHEVAPIKDPSRQQELLGMAEELGWTKHKLREAVKGPTEQKKKDNPHRMVTFEEWYSENEETLALAEDEYEAYKIVWEAARS